VTADEIRELVDWATELAQEKLRQMVQEEARGTEEA